MGYGIILTAYEQDYDDPDELVSIRVFFSCFQTLELNTHIDCFYYVCKEPKKLDTLMQFGTSIVHYSIDLTFNSISS